MKRIFSTATAATAAMASLLSACAVHAPTAQLRHATRHANSVDYSSYAGVPIKRFITFGLQGWDDVGPNRIVLWNGVNEAYLVALGGICPELRWSHAIELILPSRSVSQFDSVRVGGQVCSIDEIRPLDIKRLKFDRAAQAKLRNQS